MPWDSSPTGGFTTGWPWLPLGDEHEIVNVAELEGDDNSILCLYRFLIQYRQSHRVLVSGKLEGVKAERNVLRFERTSSEERLLVVLNMAAEPAQISAEPGTVLASTHMDRDGAKVAGQVELRAAEGLVVRMES